MSDNFFSKKIFFSSQTMTVQVFFLGKYFSFKIQLKKNLEKFFGKNSFSKKSSNEYFSRRLSKSDKIFRKSLP